MVSFLLNLCVKCNDGNIGEGNGSRKFSEKLAKSSLIGFFNLRDATSKL